MDTIGAMGRQGWSRSWIAAGIAVAASLLPLAAGPAASADAPQAGQLIEPGATDGMVGAARGPREQIRPLGPPCNAGELVRGVDTGGRLLVAFTFDDGPSPSYTRQVMDKFERRGLKATFFLVGSMIREFPDVAADIVKRGHEVANHTMTHPTGVVAKIAAQVRPTNDLIEQVTGVRPVLFRSPGLTTGAPIQRALADEGMCDVFTTVDYRDYKMPRRSAATLCASFSAMLHPGQFVLLHDGLPDHQNTVDAIDCMLDIAAARGYTVVTASELLRAGRRYSGYTAALPAAGSSATDQTAVDDPDNTPVGE